MSEQETLPPEPQPKQHPYSYSLHYVAQGRESHEQVPCTAAEAIQYANEFDAMSRCLGEVRANFNQRIAALESERDEVFKHSGTRPDDQSKSIAAEMSLVDYVDTRYVTVEKYNELQSKCEGMFEVGGFEYFNQQLTDERAESSRLRNAIELMKKERNELSTQLAATKRECEGLREVAERLPRTWDNVRVAPTSVVFADITYDKKWVDAGYSIVACDLDGFDQDRPIAVFSGVPSGASPGHTYFVEFEIDDCFSTREAAEQALAARDATEGGGE